MCVCVSTAGWIDDWKVNHGGKIDGMFSPANIGKDDVANLTSNIMGSQVSLDPIKDTKV